MRSPLISVIIPAYNNAHYLCDAIESVLTQDYPAIDLIVVDDGSTDGTGSVIASYANKLTCIYQENAGIAGARNAGYQLARGDFIAFLDSDDTFTPGRLTLQMSTLLSDSALECVQGHMEQFVSPELPADFGARIRGGAIGVKPAPMCSAMLISRAAYDRIGAWDTAFNVAIEMDWHARLRESGVVCRMLDDVVLRRRIHRTNTNLRFANEQSERLHALKKILDRRRALQAPVEHSLGDNRQ